MPSQVKLITLEWPWFDYCTVDESVWLLFSSDGPVEQCCLYHAVLTGGIKCIKGSASSFYCDKSHILTDTDSNTGTVIDEKGCCVCMCIMFTRTPWTYASAKYSANTHTHTHLKIAMEKDTTYS